ncbi:hypothetical protein ACFSNO_15235 [Streptomyces cirratus]
MEPDADLEVELALGDVEVVGQQADHRTLVGDDLDIVPAAREADLERHVAGPELRVLVADGQDEGVALLGLAVGVVDRNREVRPGAAGLERARDPGQAELRAGGVEVALVETPFPVSGGIFPERRRRHRDVRERRDHGGPGDRLAGGLLDGRPVGRRCAGSRRLHRRGLLGGVVLRRRVRNRDGSVLALVRHRGRGHEGRRAHHRGSRDDGHVLELHFAAFPSVRTGPTARSTPCVKSNALRVMRR